jgi:hypothetical protein
MKRIDKEDLPYPWEIHFMRWQMEWLLRPENWNFIKENQWPFSIRDDVISRSGMSHHAAFEMISLIKAEMEMRLESVGRDGYLCLDRYYDEYTDMQIARAFNIPIRDISRRIKRAMRYMAGKRKIITYSDWIGNGWRETPNLQKTRMRVSNNFSLEIKENTLCS